MKNIEEIRILLLEQRQEIFNKDLGIERNKLAEITNFIDTPFPVITSGLRRVGKSTLMAQLAHKFYPQKNYFYVNFEDDRFLTFTTSDFTKLHEFLVELFGNQKTFFLDEVQNISGWESFVNRMIRAGYKFYITGSNASLLSRELGTKLTGRYIPVELFPFSFDEYLRFKKITPPDLKLLTTVERGELKKAFWNYIEEGGVAEALRYPQVPIYKTLYDDILSRDIAERYKLTDTKPLREMTLNLLSNISSPVSYNKLKNLLQLGSVNTISAYVDYLEAAWLIMVINRYAFSIKKQQIANKKIYCIDTGLVKAVAFSFSGDRGKFLENAVFLKLRRIFGRDIYYYKTETDKEVDFFLPGQKTFIQVAQNITGNNTKEREIHGLLEAMDEIKGSSGIILTEERKDTLKVEGRTIRILPIYEWLV